MTRIIGVRFRPAGKIYYFAPGKFHIKKGQQVIVETARGIEFGHVVMGPKEVEEDQITQPLKSVIRLANNEDRKIEERNREKEKEAFQICLEKIRKHKLEMKLIDAEYTFDNNKVLFYFTADGRIDFRELVKDLAAVFRTRIELRQIGVRDETKLRGGIGICGRELCCHTYLSEFAPVSIKMAKEQNLSLNPTKISGVCGRLMCCLTNEQETYEKLNSRLPSTGDTVTTPEGLRGEVQSLSVLRQLVKVVVTLENDEKEIREYKASELKFKSRRKKNDMRLSKEEMKERRNWTMCKLKDGERLDDLQTHGYEIIQHPGKFCFGMDAVLLASYAKVKRGERALDIGTGTGIIPILMTVKTDGEEFTGLEIQEENADMARRSVVHNHLEDKITIKTGDIKEAADYFPAASFDVITTNPPYMIGQHGIQNVNSAKTIARHEVLCTLDDILRESARLLTFHGRFYMVHRPFRLAEIFTKMTSYGIEPKRIRFVHPYVDKEPNMVLIEGSNKGRSRMQVDPPLIVYEKDGSYTGELLANYGMGRAGEK